MPIRPLSLALALSLASGVAAADEGMWMPSQLPQLEKALRAAGFKGNPAELADLTKHPMSAVVSLGGCTASFVSPDGLVLTNHHCAFGAIQLNSTPGNNLIEKGFIAAARGEEPSAGPGARIYVTEAFDRVTDKVLAQARGQQGRAYYDAVDAATKQLVAQCEQGGGYRCSVANMYYGTDFYLIRQLEVKDVRLVYAPPRAIGNYGDETDNFMWPRHTGDFAFYRAYVGKDGKPAAYSADNVPYKAPSWLEVSTAPVAEGDFAMVVGYPGTTFRHRSAAEFKAQVEQVLPDRVDLNRSLLARVEQAIAGNEDAQVKYASQIQSWKNTLKRAQGELDGLRRSQAVSERAADEAAMLAWVAKQSKSSALLSDIRQVQAQIAAGQANSGRNTLFSALIGQTQLLRSAVQLQRLAHERSKPDAQRERGYQQRDEATIEGALKQAQRRFDPQVEQAILRELLARYRALPASQRIAEVDAVFGSDAASADQALQKLYASTGLGVEAERLRLLAAAPSEVSASNDALMLAAAKLTAAALRIDDEEKTVNGELLRLRPAYMQALIDYRQSRGRAVYPDANSTLRASYGQLQSLAPRDAVSYSPVTAVGGIKEKHTGEMPFDAPAPLLAAIDKGDWGSTADPGLKTQTVNILTNLDTTGGNSGSPVLDANGRLIAINFDSNWEGVSASWKFDPRYKRAIHVDARYMRWLMAKVYPAPHLLKEMNLPAE